MPFWLSSELRLMVAMYEGNSLAVMRELIPRHTARAIESKWSEMNGRPESERRLYWLRIAHEHYQRREQGYLK